MAVWVVMGVIAAACVVACLAGKFIAAGSGREAADLFEGNRIADQQSRDAHPTALEPLGFDRLHKPQEPA